uniref:DUF5615 domain-containing protein n=1 Tax=Chlorobium phaeobacteroides (strain BS1) TaxID=331678 RepID=B3EJX6_CHLPB
MTLWIDAHISPSIAAWINHNFANIDAKSVSALNLQYSTDKEIFAAARKANAIIMSKDSDFLKLIDQFGAPSAFIWITCGNTSNQKMRDVLSSSLEKALDLISSGEPIVEISDKA